MFASARKPAPSVAGEYSPRSREQAATPGPLAIPGRPRGGVASEAEAMEGEAPRPVALVQRSLASMPLFYSPAPAPAGGAARGAASSSLLTPPLQAKLEVGAEEEPLEREAEATAEKVMDARGGAEATRGLGAADHAAPRVSGGGAIQAKLAVGRQDDPLEHEADRVADTVLRMPDPASVGGGVRSGTGASAAVVSGRLQRECAACEKEEEEKEEGGKVQRKAGSEGAGSAGEAPAIVGETLRSGGGRPLDAEARAYFEPRFGQDFSRVRVHTDARAGESARSVNALAYTVGPDIVFGAGRYAPAAPEGRRLLAHELTHVVQQGSAEARLPGRPVAVSSAPTQVARAPASDVDPVHEKMLDALVKAAKGDAGRRAAAVDVFKSINTDQALKTVHRLNRYEDQFSQYFWRSVAESLREDVIKTLADQVGEGGITPIAPPASKSAKAAAPPAPAAAAPATVAARSVNEIKAGSSCRVKAGATRLVVRLGPIVALPENTEVSVTKIENAQNMVWASVLVETSTNAALVGATGKIQATSLIRFEKKAIEAPPPAPAEDLDQRLAEEKESAQELTSSVAEAVKNSGFAGAYAKLDPQSMHQMLIILDGLSKDDLIKLLAKLETPAGDGRYVKRLFAAIGVVAIGKGGVVDGPAILNALGSIKVGDVKEEQKDELIKHLEAHTVDNEAATRLLEQMVKPTSQSIPGIGLAIVASVTGKAQLNTAVRYQVDGKSPGVATVWEFARNQNGATFRRGGYMAGTGTRADDGSWTMTWPDEGEYRIECTVGDQKVFYFQEIVSADEMDSPLNTAFNEATTEGFESWRLTAGVTKVGIVQGDAATPMGGTGRVPFISSDTVNPTTPAHELTTFTITPSPEAKKLSWYVTGGSVSEYSDTFTLGSKTFKKIKTRTGETAMDLGSSTSVQWMHRDVGVYRIWCEQQNDAGEAINRVPFVQVVESAKDSDERGKKAADYAAYLTAADTAMENIEDDILVQIKPGVTPKDDDGLVSDEDHTERRQKKAIPVHAAYVPKKGGKGVPLIFYIGQDKSGGIALIDLQSFVTKRYYHGDDIKGAFVEFEENSSYPEGTIKFSVGGSTQYGLPGYDSTLDVKLSRADQVSEYAQKAALALGIGAAVAAVIPGLQPLALLLEVLSAAAGVTDGLANLASDLSKEHKNWKKIVIDVTTVVTSLYFGIGAASKGVNLLRTGRAFTNFGKAGSWQLYAGLAAAGTAGVLIASEGADRLLKIVENKDGLSESAVGDKLAAEIFNLIVQEMFIALMVKGMVEGGKGGSGPEAEQGAGGTRGDVYELDNTKKKKVVDADGVEKEVSIGQLGTSEKAGGRKDFDKKVRLLADSRYRYRNGAKVKDVTPGAPGQPTTFTVEVPGNTASDPAITVEATVVPKDGDALMPTEVHRTPKGDEAGPARMNLVYTPDPAGGPGKWTATIEVDAAMRPQDVPLAIGHEINEMVGIVGKNRGGAAAGAIESEMKASLFVEGSKETIPTDHDIADALELKSMVDDMQAEQVNQNRQVTTVGTPSEPIQTRIKQRQASIDKKLKAMGLSEINADPSALRARLKTLREAGISNQAINDIERIQARVELVTHFQGEIAAGLHQSIIHDEMVRHMMVPELRGGEIYGGHVTDALEAFVKDSRRFALEPRPDMTKPGGGTTWRQFEVFQWKAHADPTRPIPTAAAELPGGNDFNAADWDQARGPKTTADDLQAMLHELNAAWQHAMTNRGPTASPPGPGANGQRFEFGTPSSASAALVSPTSQVEFTVYAEYSAAEGRWKLNTSFANDAWLRNQ